MHGENHIKQEEVSVSQHFSTLPKQTNRILYVCNYCTLLSLTIIVREVNWSHQKCKQVAWHSHSTVTLPYAKYLTEFKI